MPGRDWKFRISDIIYTEILWETIQNELPPLVNRVKEILVDS